MRSPSWLSNLDFKEASVAASTRRSSLRPRTFSTLLRALGDLVSFGLLTFGLLTMGLLTLGLLTLGLLTLRLLSLGLLALGLLTPPLPLLGDWMATEAGVVAASVDL